MLATGEVFAGYTIVRPLGAGGMGEVYLAQHPRLPRREALKVLRPEISNDETFQQRFIREADSIAALEHPHIVTVHDRGETSSRLWIATQYVDGTDAAKLMRDRYPAGMPMDEAAVITTAIAEALDYAHGCGLLHRDVKPANILLSQPDRDGHRRVYLADFGIARPLEDPSGLTSTNFTVGTFAYAAPEQLMGKDIDGRADQYALAATAYHLLTGTPVFPDSNQIAVISQHLTEPAPAPSTIRPELAPLDAAFARALAKNPEDRFPTCQAFAQTITAAAPARGQSYSPTAPTQQAPIPNPRSTMKASRSRSPARVTLAVMVLGGLLVGGGLLWQTWIKQDQQTTPTTPITTTAPTSSTATAPPSTAPAPPITPLPPPPPTEPPRTTAAPAAPKYPPAGALGSWCSPSGAIGTGPDGSLYYCARLARTDGNQWALSPETIPWTPERAGPNGGAAVPISGPEPMESCTAHGSFAGGPYGLMQCLPIDGSPNSDWVWRVQ